MGFVAEELEALEEAGGFEVGLELVVFDVVGRDFEQGLVGGVEEDWEFSAFAVDFGEGEMFVAVGDFFEGVALDI